MDYSWIDHFKTQVETQRDRKIIMEEHGFCRIDHHVIRSTVCFTDIFLDIIIDNTSENASKLIKKMHSIFFDAFRSALKASVQKNLLNLPRFLIRLQENIKLRQKQINHSNYKIIHSLAFETGDNGLINVQCCFIVDIETSEPIQQKLPIIDFSISSIDHIKGRIYDPTGREILDILNPSLVTCDWFYLPNIS